MYKFRVRNELIQDENGTEKRIYDLYCYSSIIQNSELGESVRSIAQKLDELDDIQEVVLHINSDGGDLFEAYGLYNMLQGMKHNGIKISALIEGMCASSACVLAMAADKITMNAASMMFIHNPFGTATGTSEELAKYSDYLNDITEQVANIYASRTGLSVEHVKDLMNKESWMTADTCKFLGFCDEVLAPVQDKEESKVNVHAILQHENRVKDSVNMSVDTTYKPVDKAGDIIQRMVAIINQRRDRNAR